MTTGENAGTPELPDLVVHVGMPQSGGTMLQRALTALRPQLREHGVAYLSHDQIVGAEAVAGWQANANPDPAKQDDFVAEVAAMLAQEREDTAKSSHDGQVHSVLVSSHGLLGRPHIGPDETGTFRRWSEASIGQFLDAVGLPAARLVLYTHRQDRLLEYSYCQYVMAGGYDQWSDRFPNLFEPVLDYAGLVDRLASLPRVDRVHVIPWELLQRGLPEALDDFLGLVGLAGRLDLAAAQPLTTGRIYSALGVTIAREMNPHLDTKAERNDVRAFVLKNFSITHEWDSRVFDDHTRRRILDTYAESNTRLFRIHRPDLAESSYRDDAATLALSGLEPPATPSAPETGADPDDAPSAIVPPKVVARPSAQATLRQRIAPPVRKGLRRLRRRIATARERRRG